MPQVLMSLLDLGSAFAPVETTTSITGADADQMGAGFPGATVKLTNQNAGARWETEVNAADRPVRIGALRYELPEFIDFGDPQWHRKPAPYAHYVIEGSADGEHWIRLADRRHGPWRGVKTDVFSPVDVRYFRFAGTFSNGEPFRVRNVQAFRGK